MIENYNKQLESRPLKLGHTVLSLLKLSPRLKIAQQLIVLFTVTRSDCEGHFQMHRQYLAASSPSLHALVHA